jgi:hypothetical protein
MTSLVNILFASAYNMARIAVFLTRQGNVSHGAGSERGVEEKNWKALWSIEAPRKMKVVIWRLIHNCLRTSHQLQHRHILADDM